jgi:hypothetical protein
MVGRLLLGYGARVGTLVTVLGAALLPSDVGAQLPQAGSDAEEPAADDSDAIKKIDPQLLSPHEMKSLALKYSFEVANDVAKVEQARKTALLERDGIKVACIDHLLPEMRMIRDALADRFKSIARRSEDFTARADFLVISPGWQRVRELRNETEDCVGEALDTSSVSSRSSNIPPFNPAEPAEVPAHTVVVDRPTEASTYR